MIEAIPPGMVLILGALLVPLLSGHTRQAYMLLLPLLGFVQVLLLPADFVSSVRMFGYELTLVRVGNVQVVKVLGANAIEIKIQS